MSIIHSIAIIAVTAVCTMLLRAVPFLLFGQRQVPDIINYLGKFLPPAIMTTLVIYCLRNIDITAGTHGIPELISVVLVIAVHLWRKNILLTVGLGTICYMVLIQAVFV